MICVSGSYDDLIMVGAENVRSRHGVAQPTKNVSPEPSICGKSPGRCLEGPIGGVDCAVVPLETLLRSHIGSGKLAAECRCSIGLTELISGRMGKLRSRYANHSDSDSVHDACSNSAYSMSEFATIEKEIMTLDYAEWSNGLCNSSLVRNHVAESA